jgi:hypothetical protein
MELTASQAAQQRTWNAIPKILAVVGVSSLVAWQCISDKEKAKSVLRAVALVGLPLVYKSCRKPVSNLKSADAILKS